MGIVLNKRPLDLAEQARFWKYGRQTGPALGKHERHAVVCVAKGSRLTGDGESIERDKLRPKNSINWWWRMRPIRKDELQCPGERERGGKLKMGS